MISYFWRHMIDDPYTETRLALVYPDLAKRWTRVRESMWVAHNVQLRAADGLRTYSQQWAIWCEGRLKEKNGTWVICDERLVTTHAKPGESWHNFGLAIDSAFMGDDPYLTKLSDVQSMLLWNDYGKYCQEFGLIWGGNWPEKKKDRPHCQITYGMSIHTAQMLYENAGIKSVWNACNKRMECGGKS